MNLSAQQRRTPCPSRQLLATAGLVAAACLAPAPAAGQSITWSGTGANANWSTSGNWGPATPPGNGFSRGFVFAGTNLLSNTNTLTGGTMTSGTFSSGAGAFVISGSALTLAGNIRNDSTSLQTFNLDLTSAATRTLTLTAGGGNLAFGGKLSGAGGYTLGGTGTVTISGTNNDYLGNTTFAANQTLNINSNQALGSGTLVADGGGSFNNTSGSDRTITNNFNISNGSPTFIGTGNLAITGTTTISGANRSVTVSSSTLTLARIDADTTARTFTKAGAGTLAITGSAGPNLQGAFIYSAGSLILGHKNALGSGTFRITGGSTPGIRASADLSGANAIPNVVTGSANATVSGSNSITFSGPWTNAGGDRTLTSSLDAGKTLTLSGSVFLSESTATGRLWTIAGTGNTTVSGVIADADGSGQPGRVTISNTVGLTSFTGANTYTGTTTISNSNDRTILRAVDGVGLPTASFLQFYRSGILESSGTFSRTTGTSGAGNVGFPTGNWSAGFAAVGSDLTIKLNGGGELVYVVTGSIAGHTPTAGTPGWFTNSNAFATQLTLGSVNADAKVAVANPLDLNGHGAGFSGSRYVLVIDNPNSRSDFAELSGNIRNTYTVSGSPGNLGLNINATTRDGLLVLSGTNSYTNGTYLTSGVTRATDGVGIPSPLLLGLMGGVFESSGTMSRAVGSTLTWAFGTANGGFSAYGGRFTIRFNNTTTGTYTWGGGGGNLKTGAPLMFNSIYSDNVVEWTNILDLNNAQREIFVNDNPTTAADSAAMSGAIIGTGASGLLKTGPGTLKLSGTNTFAGGATVTEGTLLVGIGDNGSTSGALGTAAAVVGGTSGSAAAAILVDGAFTLSRNITVQAGSTGAATLGGSNTTGTASFTGNVTLNRSVTLQAATGGTVAFGTGSWTTNDNAVTIGSAGNAGVVQLANTLSSTAGVTVAFGTLALSGAGSLDGASAVALTAAGAAFDISGVSPSGITIGTFSGSAGSAVALGGKNLLVNQTADAIFAGAIAGTGGGFSKQGTAALTLTGTSSYTGATSVDAGRLFVNGQLGNTALTVNSGGFLGGSGSVLGSVSVLTGGTFSPGNSPGLFTTGSMSLAGVTLMEIDATGVRGTAYDAVTVTNALTYGGTMEIDFAFVSAVPDFTIFNLFDFDSQSGFFSGITTKNDGSYYGGLSFNGSGDVWTATKGSQTLEFTHSSGNLVIVPEPEAAVLAGLGAAVAAAVLRRRRR